MLVKNAKITDIEKYLKQAQASSTKAQWCLLGVLIRNDRIEIEELKSLFGRNGYYNAKYKTCVTKLYNALMDNKGELEILGKNYNLNELGNVNLDEGSPPFSISVWYDKLPKEKSKDKTPVISKEVKAEYQALIDDTDIDTGCIETPAEFNKKLNSGVAVIKEQAQALLDEARLRNRLSLLPSFDSEDTNPALLTLEIMLRDLFEHIEQPHDVLSQMVNTITQENVKSIMETETQAA